MSTDSSEDPRIGTTVGKYTLTRLIGVGGMGRVYEGKHETLAKRFALKFIDRDNVTEESFARFEREAKAASSVDSPHIVDVFDVGTTTDGLPFIVMELLRGEDLGQMIRRLGPLEVDVTLKIVAQVLRGLVRAHEIGVVHRDLKPDNVFLVDRDDDETFIKILDFGVSKIPKETAGGVRTLTREGVVLGTLVYMSPEQAQAAPDLDERTDLWAMGAILYECLAGRPAFTGATYESVIVTICTQDPPDLASIRTDLSPGLVAVVKRALMRDRTARFSSAREMLDVLVAESNGVLPISMRSDSMKRVRGAGSSSASGSTPRLSPGPATLGAVSTIAVTPDPSRTPGPAPSRAPVLLGGISIAAVGVFAGVWLSKGAGSEPRNSSTSSVAAPTAPAAAPSSPSSTDGAPSTATGAPSVAVVASSALADPSSAPTTRPTATASQGPTAKVLRSSSPKGSAAPIATATATATATASATGGGLGQGLQLKKN
jgi:eukaryotic-like serine/threonine-protein kinase